MTSAADGSADRSGKAIHRSPDMHVIRKSDGPIVPRKPANNGGQPLAESVEGRGSAKGNAASPAACGTQSPEQQGSSGLTGMREAARRDRRARFTALMHHITPGLLRDSYESLRREAGPGVDGETWEHYGDGLHARIPELHERIQSERYRARPSKRSYIPKSDGSCRPLGITCLEDKIVQRAVVTVLTQIYEVDFRGFSYGYRPARKAHDALDALYVGLTERRINWVLDADIRGFFDTINHDWMLRFLEHRIGDQRMLRLIRKWLRAGISEEGEWRPLSQGTPQGSVISPLLANVYLHYVLDWWADHWRQNMANGEVIIVRYADDFVIGFQFQDDADRFLAELRARLSSFSLELHPEKTRLIAFGQFANRNAKRQGGGKGKPATFDFLGFTHICSRRRDGRYAVRRLSVASRMRSKLREIRETLLRNRHRSVAEMGQWLGQVVRGWMNYHAVPYNSPRIFAFRSEVARAWRYSLSRRSQRKSRWLAWPRFSDLINRYIPPARILHPWPNQRLRVTT